MVLALLNIAFEYKMWGVPQASVLTINLCYK